MKKSAMTGGDIAKIVGALGVGGVFGHSVMPHVSGYQDVEPARRISGTLYGTTAALLAALALGKGRGLGPGLKEVMNLTDPRQAMMIAGALPAAELVPVGVATLSRQQKAMQDLSQSGREMARSAVPPSVENLLKSRMGRGAGVGAGLAGLGGLATGLTRRRTDEELASRKTRGSMVSSDVLKYLLPAILAGGVVGSLGTKQPTRRGA